MKNSTYVKDKIEEYGCLDSYISELGNDLNLVYELIENTEILNDPIMSTCVIVLIMCLNMSIPQSVDEFYLNEDNIYLYKESEKEIKQ